MNKHHTPMRQLIAAAKYYGVQPSEVMGRSRKRHVVRARWAVMYALYNRSWSLPAIGELFDRDHTTVLHGLQCIEADWRLRAELTESLGRAA